MGDMDHKELFCVIMKTRSSKIQSGLGRLVTQDSQRSCVFALELGRANAAGSPKAVC